MLFKSFTPQIMVYFYFEDRCIKNRYMYLFMPISMKSGASKVDFSATKCYCSFVAFMLKMNFKNEEINFAVVQV